MIHAGTSQRRIARTLNVAYANGLLSHDTFVRRTDTLLSGGVIDPGAIVGDLAFRRESARLERFQAAISRLVITVSRCHARLRYRDGRWILQDLSSTNGTHVNGVPVGRCELRPGDHVALGEECFTID
jgi:FHA domain-containing protein